MEVEDLRISKLRIYLLNIVKAINEKCQQINVNMLSEDINNYSLDKIPTQSSVEKYINGTSLHKDVYSFRSRNSYSQDTIVNLKQIGFFEIFEKVINSNNEEGILPEIEGIESIECLNCGSMNSATTNTAEFDIQIQIEYRR